MTPRAFEVGDLVAVLGRSIFCGGVGKVTSVRERDDGILLYWVVGLTTPADYGMPFFEYELGVALLETLGSL